MANRNLAIVSGQGRSKRGGGIALHQDHIGLKTVAGIFDRVQHARGKRVERLVRTHHIQVEIGFDFEVLENMVEHRAMLTGMHHRSLKLFGTAAQFVNHQGQLDGFRTRAQDSDNPTFHEDTPSLD